MNLDMPRTPLLIVLVVGMGWSASCTDRTPLGPPDGPGWDWSGIMTGANLNCHPGSTVPFNETLTCSVHTPPGSFFAIEEWRFDFTDWEFPIPAIQTGIADPFWAGPVVHSGVVTVSGVLNGIPEMQSFPVTVTRRSGWSWADSVRGQPGSPGEIDQCFLTGNLGITAGRSCDSSMPSALFSPQEVADSGGFTPKEVPGSGPNGGVYYVDEPTIVMDLRTQITREFRADADPSGLPMVGDTVVVNACGPDRRNAHYVNTICAPEPAFNEFVSYVWDHEKLHMDSAVAAGKTPQQDLHFRWEPIVGPDASTLRMYTNQRLLGIHNAILQAAACTHTGQVPNPSWAFWRNLGAGWGTDTITVDEQKPSHC